MEFSQGLKSGPQVGNVVKWDFTCDFQTLRLLPQAALSPPFFSKALILPRIHSWHVCNYFLHLVNCKENWGFCFKPKYLGGSILNCFRKSGQQQWWKLITCKYSWQNMLILEICNHHPCLHNVEALLLWKSLKTILSSRLYQKSNFCHHYG